MSGTEQRLEVERLRADKAKLADSCREALRHLADEIAYQRHIGGPVGLLLLVRDVLRDALDDAGAAAP
jgi:hypothetical protein